MPQSSSSSGSTPSNGTANGDLGFQASQGTLSVSKPFRSPTSNKLRAMVTFTPRKSLFDISNEHSGSNEFRGFFTLFWISLFLFTIRTYILSMEDKGYPLELGFASIMSRDAVTLAISDAVLVLNTGLCIPFAWAISKGYIKYHYTGQILQHIWQALVLATAVTWTFNRHWPWVQSGFLTLHSFVMIMKMHSYMSTNGELESVNRQAEKVHSALRKAADEVGGWEAALASAKENRERLAAEEASDTKENTILTGNLFGGSSTPGGTTTSIIDATDAVALRRRLAATNRNGNGNTSFQDGVQAISNASEPRPTKVETTGNRVIPPAETVTTAPADTILLTYHPSEKVSRLALEHAELESELTSSGPARVRWPNNISLKDFALYQLTPTLVYELEYPRTEKIRPLYVFEKTVAFFGTFVLLYTVTETFILPLTPTSDQSFFRSLLDLALPFMLAYLLLFYIIFECICNGFAELSRFADRKFYDDWWNSTSWDEFSRKWNRPVHTFLLRHVYASTMSSYRLTRQSAMFVTFLLSAAAHELVMAIVTKKIRMYLFTLQLIQIPLIAIGRIPAIKRNRLLGNIVFWLGLYAGFPLLCVAYVAY